MQYSHFEDQLLQNQFEPKQAHGTSKRVSVYQRLSEQDPSKFVEVSRFGIWDLGFGVEREEEDWSRVGVGSAQTSLGSVEMDGGEVVDDD
ncbi:hypothetical protein LWI28_014176 [Acer negundo]|uniref:Uncharacterized protein n=1 Tax=Acer negundo TaxID=4023 RepID=A0AAD5IMZ7_ACENE|nr:hypothetical protein LWI28_014176 [Acer negundo]KAK4842267.1 hypothetical protein QYF36_018832 [Acer negundo]